MPTRNIPPNTGAGSARVIYGEFGADGGYSDAGLTALVNPRPRGVWEHLDRVRTGLVDKRVSPTDNGLAIEPTEIGLVAARTITGAGAIALTDERRLVVCNSASAITVTLPVLASAGDGWRVEVLNIGAGTVTLDPDGTELIAGNATVDLVSGFAFTLVASGALGWRVLGRDAIARVPGLSAGNYLMVIDANGRISGGAAVPDVSNIAQGRRQTVLFGPVDTNGRPSFLPATATGLNLTSQSVSSTAPLVVHAANGAENRQGTRTSNLTWSSLANNATSFLFVDIASDGTMTTGHTTLAPTYREGGAAVVTNGQATFDIAAMVMRVGDGTNANQTWRVFVGEAVTSGGNVTSTVAYAYQGRATRSDSVWPATASLLTFNHNIGVTPRIARIAAECLTAEANYAVGQLLDLPLTGTAAGVFPPITPYSTRNQTLARTGAVNSLVVINATTGIQTGATSANWRPIYNADRGW